MLVFVLQEEGGDFEALPWYSAVERFCHGQGYEESENMDMKTLPTITEKTILSKVQGDFFASTYRVPDW